VQIVVPPPHHPIELVRSLWSNTFIRQLWVAERCKAAVLAQKLKGKKFGVQLRSKAWQRKIAAMGRAALVNLANENAEAHRLNIEWALRQPGSFGGAISFRAAANRLEFGVRVCKETGKGRHVCCNACAAVDRYRSDGCMRDKIQTRSRCRRAKHVPAF
jgi:hypothetical protein